MHNARMSHAQQAQTPHNTCIAKAYAKINLTLDVLGRREDGYHALATVMQTVDVHDTLRLSIADDNQVRVICTTPTLSNDENLAVRAAQLLRRRLGLTQGVLIELEKCIPVAAGLGGGSSDAAAVLLALQEWWRLPLSSSDLLELAASLGSDVPFFLSGGLALCEGRGERVTTLAAYWPEAMSYLLLLKPTISITTAAVFRALPASDYTDGRYSRAVCSALCTGKMPRAEDLHNSLERSVLEHYPEVNQARRDLVEAGASLVRLSGSGPTLFAPFAEQAHAIWVQQRLQDKGYEVYLSRAIHPHGGSVSLC
jgi:4-diphosphocytidyl-2-C-methyl-D-erythritol kinase